VVAPRGPGRKKEDPPGRRPPHLLAHLVAARPVQGRAPPVLGRILPRARPRRSSPRPRSPPAGERRPRRGERIDEQHGKAIGRLDAEDEPGPRPRPSTSAGPPKPPDARPVDLCRSRSRGAEARRRAPGSLAGLGTRRRSAPEAVRGRRPPPRAAPGATFDTFASPTPGRLAGRRVTGAPMRTKTASDEGWCGGLRAREIAEVGACSGGRGFPFGGKARLRSRQVGPGAPAGRPPGREEGGPRAAGSGRPATWRRCVAGAPTLRFSAAAARRPSSARSTLRASPTSASRPRRASLLRDPIDERQARVAPGIL
jgi:hypothetical protein